HVLLSFPTRRSSDLSQPELLHASIKRRAADAELLRGGDDVTGVAPERGANRVELDRLERHRTMLGARCSAVEPEIRGSDRAVSGHQHRPLDHVNELAYVARPAVAAQRRKRGLGEAVDLAA